VLTSPNQSTLEPPFLPFLGTSVNRPSNLTKSIVSSICYSVDEVSNLNYYRIYIYGPRYYTMDLLSVLSLHFPKNKPLRFIPLPNYLFNLLVFQHIFVCSRYPPHSPVAPTEENIQRHLVTFEGSPCSV
jgi:hypothetical protein